jgi:hypothetical protein
MLHLTSQKFEVIPPLGSKLRDGGRPPVRLGLPLLGYHVHLIWGTLVWAEGARGGKEQLQAEIESGAVSPSVDANHAHPQLLFTSRE